MCVLMIVNYVFHTHDDIRSGHRVQPIWIMKYRLWAQP